MSNIKFFDEINQLAKQGKLVSEFEKDAEKFSQLKKVLEQKLSTNLSNEDVIKYVVDLEVAIKNNSLDVKKCVSEMSENDLQNVSGGSVDTTIANIATLGILPMVRSTKKISKQLDDIKKEYEQAVKEEDRLDYEWGIERTQLKLQLYKLRAKAGISVNYNDKWD